jgi:hypothetical protein
MAAMVKTIKVSAWILLLDTSLTRIQGTENATQHEHLQDCQLCNRPKDTNLTFASLKSTGSAAICVCVSSSSRGMAATYMSSESRQVARHCLAFHGTQIQECTPGRVDGTDFGWIDCFPVRSVSSVSSPWDRLTASMTLHRYSGPST